MAIDLTAALDELPLFPLPKTVLFPGAMLPLHVFEPRYLAMTKHCLATHKVMGISLIPAGHEGEDPPPLSSVVGVGVIVEAAELSDGRFNVLLRGEARARIEELPFVPPFRRARAEVLLDEPDDPTERDWTALLSLVTAFTSAVRAQNPTFDFHIPPQMSGVLAANLIAQHLLLDPQVRQTLLETSSPRERVRRTLDTLATQYTALVSKHDGALAN